MVADVFDNIMICSSCKRKTVKDETVKDGFRIRLWRCPSCNKTWPHPGDMQEYQKFKELKSRDFAVKLRMVGNSYTISIPKEIVMFHELRRDEIVTLTPHDRDRIVLYFSRMAKFINKGEG